MFGYLYLPAPGPGPGSGPGPRFLPSLAPDLPAHAPNLFLASLGPNLYLLALA